MPRTKKSNGKNDRGRRPDRRPPKMPTPLPSHADPFPTAGGFTDVNIEEDYGVGVSTSVAAAPPSSSRRSRLGFGFGGSDDRRGPKGPPRPSYDYEDEYGDDVDDDECDDERREDSDDENDSEDDERRDQTRKRRIATASVVVLSVFVGSCLLLLGGASSGPHGGNKTKFQKNPFPTTPEYDPWGEEGDMGTVREHPGDYDHSLVIPEETSGDFKEVDDDDNAVADWSGYDAVGGGGGGGTPARAPEDWLEDDDEAIGGAGGGVDVDDAGSAGGPGGGSGGSGIGPDLSSLRGLGSLSEPYRPGVDLPIFWHVPKCGGTTLEDILVHCARLVAACQIGVLNGHDKDKELRIVTYPPDDPDGGRYVNVDTHSHEGLERAHELHLGVSGLADVALTEYLHQASWMFAPPAHVGKCFALLRHPIERAVSMFYYLRDATWEGTYDASYRNETIEEYARSDKAEENWMVRYLTNEPRKALTVRHLEFAKAVLREKCLVGLLDRFELSLRRFESYFGWNEDSPSGRDPEHHRRDCERYVLGKGGDNVHPHPTYEEGSEVWESFRRINALDLELYEYAVGLFEEQAVYDN